MIELKPLTTTLLLLDLTHPKNWNTFCKDNCNLIVFLIEPVLSASQRSSAILTPRLNSEAVLSNEASRISRRTSRAPRINPIIPLETDLVEACPLATEIESTDVSRSILLKDIELLLSAAVKWCCCCCCAWQNMSLHVASPQLRLLRNMDEFGVERLVGEISFSRPSGGTRFRPFETFPALLDFRLPKDELRFEVLCCSPSPCNRLSRPEK